MEKKSLKELRLEKGKTQLQLAYESGVSLSSIIKAEQYKQSPRIENAEKIAAVLGVGIGDIEWSKKNE